MFEQKNSLPGAERETGADDGDDFAGAGQHHPQVTGHVVRSLQSVHKIRRIFWHQTLEIREQISLSRGIGIFKNDETAAGMAHEDRGGAIPYATGPHGAGHFIGDFVCCLAAGGEGKDVVMNGHEKNSPMSLAGPELKGNFPPWRPARPPSDEDGGYSRGQAG